MVQEVPNEGSCKDFESTRAFELKRLLEHQTKRSSRLKRSKSRSTTRGIFFMMRAARETTILHAGNRRGAADEQEGAQGFEEDTRRARRDRTHRR